MSHNERAHLEQYHAQLTMQHAQIEDAEYVGAPSLYLDGRWYTIGEADTLTRAALYECEEALSLLLDVTP